MSFEIWIAFLIATSVLLAIPGPTVMLVVSYALGFGKKTGWATVPGVALGDFTAMTASLIGAGAILATSATLFTILKLSGAIYLIWLGVRLWRANPEPGNVQELAGARSQMNAFWHAYVVTALNPKSIIFFVAFLPQFIDPELPSLQQFLILELTFLVLAVVNVTIWAVLAGKMSECFRQAKTLQLVNRIGGGILVGAGLLTAGYSAKT